MKEKYINNSKQKLLITINEMLQNNLSFEKLNDIAYFIRDITKNNIK